MTADPTSHSAPTPESGDTAVPGGLKNLFLDRLKALLSQERSVLDELHEKAPEAGRRRDLFQRLCGDARALRGDGLAFGLPRVSQIGSAVEALIAEFLSGDEERRARRARTATNGVIDALRVALDDLDAEIERAETRSPAPSDPPECLPRLTEIRSTLTGESSAS